MDGRILTKTQSATTLIGGMLSNFSYDNEYKYNTNQPHTLKDVIDSANYQHFEWDANGNLTFHEHELNGTQRRLCWDEENRLMAVGDNNYTSYYLYDNAGERTYKLTGLNTMMNINGRWVNFATMDNPTLYTGAYLVAGIQGYTKHYYAGSERVSSAIGLGGLANINDPLSIEKYENWKIKAGSLKDEMSRTINECLKNEYDIKNSLEFLHGMEEAAAGTMDRYFYHPDHLGSSSWITDGKGYAIQHLHYLPFGEDWVDQRNASWSAPYTFSGKEKDVETGYSYFGARYYDSGLSIWLSVDPMSDKYPNLTSYNYCYNNPMKFVDPTGQEMINPDDPPIKQIDDKNKSNISNISWGETSGLYPTKNVTNPSESEKYSPEKWDKEKVNELLKARAAINLIGTERNKDVRKASPNLKNSLIKKLAAYHLKDNFPDVDKEIKENKNAKYFFLDSDPNAKHTGLDYKNNDVKIVKTYGPFYNNGGGDVDKGSTYIIFYEATPKKK